MSDRMKTRFENILYYHKSKILAVAGAAVLLIAGIALNSGSEAETALYGVAVNVEVSEETVDEVCSHAAEAIGMDPEQEKILLETGIEIDVENPESNAMSGNLEKLSVSVFSHELDLMICTEEVMDYYAGLGGLERLDAEWAEEEKLPDGTEAVDHLVESHDKSGGTGYYGISISNTLLSDGEDTVFCVFRNSEHKDEAMTFVRSLFQEE